MIRPEPESDVRTRVREMLAEDPRPSGAEIARRLGITRQRVYQHLDAIRRRDEIAADHRG